MLIIACRPKSQTNNSLSTTDSAAIDSFCIRENGFEYTRLGMECKKGNPEEVKKLIAQGADKEWGKQDEYLTYDALFIAIENKHLPVAEYLVENDADVNRVYTEEGLTPLGLACKVNDANIVAFLLSKGANPNGVETASVDYREIPLLTAFENKNLRIAKLLLRAGADVSKTDGKGNTLKSLLLKGGKGWEELISEYDSIGPIPTDWQGVYSGAFLKMKEEEADPRAWATVTIEVGKADALLRIEAYEKNESMEYVFRKEENNEALFTEKDNPKTEMSIAKKDGQYMLKSDFIDNLLKERQAYSLEKTDQ